MEIVELCKHSGLALHTLDLSITNLLNQTAETLFNSISVEEISELNLACTGISFSALDALYRKYQRGVILE